MTYQIKNIELQIEDEIIEMAEQLLDQPLLHPLEEIDKNLWVGSIGNQEIEILATRTTIKAFTCECGKSSEKLPCQHIVAGFLILGKKQKEAEQQRKEAARTKKAPAKKFTTAVILKNINHHDLVDFVRNYSKQNRSFAIAFKAHFASAIDMDDSKDKYDQLLEVTIKSVQRQNQKISYKGIKQILSIAEELKRQGKTAMEIADYPEAFAVFQSIFDKVSSVLNKAEKNKKDLVYFLKDNLSLLNQLFRKNLAPLLKEEIRSFCLQQFPESKTYIYQFDQFWLSILIASSLDQEQIEEVITLLDNGINNPNMPRKSYVSYLIAKMSLLEKTKQKAALEKLINDNLQQADILLIAIEKAIQQDNLPQAKRLAKYGLKQMQNSSVKEKLTEQMLAIAQLQKDKKNIRIFGLQCFLVDYNFEYLTILKANYQTKKWPDALDRILENIHKQTYTLEKRNALSEILYQEKRLDQLLAYIQKIRSLDLLQKYDVPLIAFDKETVYLLYEDLLNDYVKHHMGRQTSIKVREVLTHLRQSEAKTLADKMIVFFRSQYATRHSLMEELDEI